MTIQQVIDMTDSARANMIPRPVKVMFLNEIENKIHRQIIMTHEHTPEQETAPTYDDNTDPSTEMLVPDDHAVLYDYWLRIKIDQVYQEEEKEMNDWARFNAEWEDFRNDWNREHMAIAKAPYYTI